MLDDYALIEASFLQQYGIRLSEQSIPWREFVDLLGCLNEDTPLARVVAIRSETDRKVINSFTKAQRRIYDAWNHTAPAGIDEFFALFKSS